MENENLAVPDETLKGETGNGNSGQEQQTAKEFTAQEMLSEVNNAITTILRGGQSYKIGSRSLTRADLNALKSLRSELQAQSASEQENSLLSNAYVCSFDTR